MQKCQLCQLCQLCRLTGPALTRSPQVEELLALAVLPLAMMPARSIGSAWRLLLVVVPAAASELPAGAFGDRAALQAAVDAWVADPAAAEATHGSISGWDTSRVDDLSELFGEKSAFNEAIGGWDTSKVTTMRSTFVEADAFNQPLAWDTGKVSPVAWDTRPGFPQFGQCAALIPSNPNCY